MSKAFILDILEHSRHEDDMTDAQKKFSYEITQQIEKQYESESKDELI